MIVAIINTSISGAFMKFLCLIIVLLGMSDYLSAAELSGRVISAVNGLPIIGANVTIQGTKYGTATNDKGIFILQNIPAGEYQLTIDFIGYKLSSSPILNITEKDPEIITFIMEEDVYLTSEIVVTGTRTNRLIKDSPVTTEVIHADEIKNLGAENVGEVLEERAGIIINQDGVRGGLLSAQLQGLNGDHTLIMIDGSPVIGRIAGQLDLSRISVQNIDRIEIVKGAASSLYGSEAVGGVINIITREPEESFKYFGNANIGSYRSLNAKLDLSFAKNKTSFLTTAESHRSDGYDLDPTTANTTADAFVNYSLFGKIKQKVSDVYSLQASANYFTQHQEGFDGGFRLTDTRTWYISANNDWILNNLSNFKFRLYHTSYTKDINREDVNVLNIEGLSRAEFIYNRVIDNHILTIGAEGSYNQLESNRLEEGLRSVQNTSFYVQDEIFHKWIEYNFGIRLDYHSEFKWNYSPKVGLLIKPGERFRIRGSLSNGFRAPNFVELYLDLDHSGLTSQPYIAFGNPNLTPETSLSLNIGLEYHASTQTIFKLNGFHNTLKNMINSVFLYTNSDGVQFYTYENLASAKTRGIEFDGLLRFWDSYRLTLGYSYLETFDLSRNQPFFNRPKHSARIKFDWEYDTLGFSGNLRWRYIGERLYITMQGEETIAPWYAMWFIRLKQRVFNPVSLFVEVNNIFDYQNRDYVAIPGRMIFIGIEIN
jgi:outer membrane receptor for ferrienterochelin and colicins